MKKKWYLLGWFIWSLINTTMAQSEKIIVDFELKINQFRYNLYPALMKIPDDEIRQMDFQKEGKITQQIEKFIETHRTEIEKYQKAKLQLFSQYKIDMSLFEVDSLFKEEDLKSEDLLKLVIYQPFLRLNFINPIEGMFIYMNMLLPRKLSLNEISPLFTRNAIARPLPSAQKKSEQVWLVYLDTYRYLFEFEYNLKDIQVKPLKVYRRKVK